jgi:L-ascorbate metabolism protein UlaG (beta-lactamase superfamily)
MSSLTIRLLGWAGLQLDCDGYRLVIDPFADLGPFAAMADGPSPALLAPEAPVDGALLTHLHRDHADAPTLAAALRAGAPVLCPHPADGPGDENVTAPEKELAEAGLALRRVVVGDTASLGPFTVTAVEAVDGLGDKQVSWVVEAGGVRILHAGDTVWHGSWWRLAKTFGAFDAAFLPANGARVAFPWLSPAADVPAAMTPEEAVEAARALGAQQLIAIHHGVLEHPKFYRPRPDVPGAVAAAAARYDYPARVAVAGEVIEL